MADSRNILTRLLESEAALPYVLGTAGALAGGSLLYCYLLRKLRLDAIQRVDYSPVSDNVVVEENVVSTATAEAKDNTLMGGNLTNRAMGFQAKTSAIGNKITDGDLVNNPHSSSSQTPEISQTIVQQTAQKAGVLSTSRGDGREEKRDNQLSSSPDSPSESDIGKALSSSSAISRGNNVNNGNLNTISLSKVNGGINTPLVVSHTHILTTPAESPTLPLEWNLPRCDHFILRREMQLHDMESALSINGVLEDSKDQNESFVSQRLALTVLGGLGGVGKTQLALYYAHQYSYKHKIWFFAATRNELDIEYCKFAKHCGIKIEANSTSEMVREKVKELFRTNKNWLAVYDNVADYDEIADYLPTQGSLGHVLLTSRCVNWPEGDSITLLRIHVMTPGEAETLLEKLIGRADPQIPDLARTLEYLPLALAQAGAYIKKNRDISVADYLKRYAENSHEYLADPSFPKGTFHLPVATTWDVSLAFIQGNEKKSGQPNIARIILTVCAYFAPRNIPTKLLECWLKRIYSNLDARKCVREALAQLSDYSMIDYAKDGQSLSVHCLVQEVLRHQHQCLKAVDVYEYYPQLTSEWFSFLQKSAVEIFRQEEGMLENSERYNSLSHLLNLLSYEDAQKWEKTECSASILSIAGSILIQTGNPNEAKIYFERTLQVEKELYKEENEKIGITLRKLGDACGALGDIETKKKHLEHAVTILENEEKQVVDVSSSHPYSQELAIALVSLGSLCGALGDVETKIKYTERALKMFEKHYDNKDDPIMIPTLGTLGNAYAEQGKKKDAEKLLMRTLKLCETKYGLNHSWTAITLSGLASVCQDLGQTQRAQTYLECALAFQQKFYQGNHWQLGLTYLRISKVSLEKNMLSQACEEAEQAIDIFRCTQGEKHPNTQMAQSLLCKIKLLQQYSEEKENAIQSSNSAMTVSEMSPCRSRSFSVPLPSLSDKRGLLFHRKSFPEYGVPYESSTKERSFITRLSKSRADIVD